MRIDFDYDEKRHTIHLDTDDDILKYSDCLSRNEKILDEVEDYCKDHFCNPTDYLFFLTEYVENERKDNV